jgi:hypothetical protein
MQQTLGSKNDSASLICFQAIELEVLRQMTTESTQLRQEFLSTRCVFDLKRPIARRVWHHFIALPKTQRLS